MHSQPCRQRTERRATTTALYAFCAFCAVFGKCTGFAATPVAGSGTTARARGATAAQQLKSSSKSSEAHNVELSRRTRTLTNGLRYFASGRATDIRGPGQSLHPGGLCREVRDHAGEGCLVTVVAAGQARDAKERREALLRLRRRRALQLCLCGNAGSLCEVPELGQRWWKRSQRQALELDTNDRFLSRGCLHSRRHRQQHGQHSSAGLLRFGSSAIQQFQHIGPEANSRFFE